MIRQLRTWFRKISQPFNPPRWDHTIPETFDEAWDWVIVNGTDAITPTYLADQCSAETFVRRKLVAWRLTH